VNRVARGSDHLSDPNSDDADFPTVKDATTIYEVDEYRRREWSDLPPEPVAHHPFRDRFIMVAACLASSVVASLLTGMFVTWLWTTPPIVVEPVETGDELSESVSRPSLDRDR
jgi:hypothetical protein